MAAYIEQLGPVLDGVLATAAASLRTYTKALQGAKRIRWTAILATWATSTDLTITVYTSVDDGENYGLVQSQAVSAGKAVLSDYYQSKALGSAKEIDGWLDTEGATHVRIVLASAGATTEVLSLIASLSKETR